MRVGDGKALLLVPGDHVGVGGQGDHRADGVLQMVQLFGVKPGAAQFLRRLGDALQRLHEPPGFILAHPALQQKQQH